MATPALKNFLMLSTERELGHKPALLVSVSASINGVYPISELRMTGSKNNHVCFLPDHLIFRNSETIVDDTLTCTDSGLHERTLYTLSLLREYAQALGTVRNYAEAGGVPFRYGM